MPRKKRKFVAIIGDLVGSRTLQPKERNRVQKRFQKALDKINKDFRDEIASLFLITVGDEAQGILHRTNDCYEILRRIQLELAPTEIVFGIGYGILTTEMKEFAVGADGPAFHFAREALTKTKEERKVYGKSILREVRFNSDDPLQNKVIDALFLAISVFKSQWTSKQTEILNLLEQGYSPTDVSESLGLPLSNVSRTIDSSDYREFEDIAQTLQTIFQERFEGSQLNKLSKK